LSLDLLARSIGLAGDCTTFAGALILAIHESREGERTRIIEGTITAIEKYPETRGIPIDIDGTVVEKASDVKIAIRQHASKSAIKGAWILTIGFVLIAIARGLEIWNVL